MPSNELGDVMDTKSKLWKFLERMNDLTVANKWPQIIPLGPGSFFSYTLLPWFQTFDEPAYWEAMEVELFVCVLCLCALLYFLFIFLFLFVFCAIFFKKQIQTIKK